MQGRVVVVVLFPLGECLVYGERRKICNDCHAKELYHGPFPTVGFFFYYG